jgi:hypothetical protein
MRNHFVPYFKTKQERVAFWYPICQAKLTSKLSWAEFCNKYRVSKSPLQKWIKHFEKYPYISRSSNKLNSTTTVPSKTIKKNQNNSVFLPVSVINETEPKINAIGKQPNNYMAIKSEEAPVMELLFPNGVKIIFRQEVNINLLMPLITAGGI